MKKELFTLGGIVACILVVLFFTRFYYPRIAYWDVKEVRLYTYDHEVSKEVGLSGAEARNIIRLYNLSLHGGEVTGQPCCDGYRVTIDLTNGSTITLSEGARDKAVLTGPGGRWHYLTNQALIDYILELAEQYNLPKP